MASQATLPFGNDEDAAFETYVKSLAAQAVKDASAPKNPDGTLKTESQQQQAQPLKVNIGGQDYEFQDVAQLNAALNTTFSGVQKTIADLQAAQAGRVTSDEEEVVQPKFDMKSYMEKMGTSPIEAADYLDEHRIGMKGEDIKRLLKKTEELTEVVAAAQFREKHPYFNALGGAQAATELNKLRGELGLPFTLDGLEAAYALAQNRGVIPNEQTQFQLFQQKIAQSQQQQQAAQKAQFEQLQKQFGFGQPNPQQQQNQSQFNQVQNPFNQFSPQFNNNPYQLNTPPVIGRSDTQQQMPSFEDAAENLSPAQIEAIFNRAGRNQ